MNDVKETSPHQWMTRVAFGLLLALVIARCLMLEVAREAMIASTNGPGPATSTFLDWLTFVPMLLILARRVVDREYALRFTWAHVAFGLLAVWTLLSVAWAGDRWLALVGSMHILAGASLFWSMSQLVRRWEHLRVVVGVCVGLLLANFVQGLFYRFVDLPDLQHYFVEHKAEILAENRWKPGEFMANRFEQKLMAGEMLGFNASANTLGAIVVLLSLITLGAAMQRLEDRDDQGWIGICFIIALTALYPLAYTGSKASWAALLLGIGLLAFWRLTRRWLSAHHGFVFTVATASVALAIVTVLAVGLSTGGLPNDSINFRWRYWVAAWASVAEHPLIGVGWGNFASTFLEHRLPVSAEEINDPHNFLVRWASELGIVGLVLGSLWLITWFWHTSGTLAQSERVPSAIRVKTVLWVGALGFLLSLFAVDWSQVGETDRFYAAVLETLRRLLLTGLITLGIGILCVRDAEYREVDSRPAPWLGASVFIGIIAFLLQSAIDIAFFQPGPFMLCVMLLGASIGLSLTDKPRRANAIPVAGLVGSVLMVVVVLIAVVIPVALAESNANYARYLSPNQPERAAEMYRKAFRQAPVRNADYLLRAFEVARASGTGSDTTLRELLDQAISADPTSSRTLLTRARYLFDRAPTEANISQCLADYGNAILMNPNDVDLRIEYAGALERFGKRDEAAAQLAAALETNEAYDPAEPERIELRLPGELERIRSRITALRTATP
jgi:hypothetical protein